MIRRFWIACFAAGFAVVAHADTLTLTVSGANTTNTLSEALLAVEQFGTPHSPKGCYLTIHNPSDKPAETTLVPVHGFSAAAEYADVISGVKVPVGSCFSMPPYATWTIDLRQAVLTSR